MLKNSSLFATCDSRAIKISIWGPNDDILNGICLRAVSHEGILFKSPEIDIIIRGWGYI